MGASCRPFKPEDKEGVLALYRAVFDLDMSPQTWDWFYSSMPQGPAVIVVAENDTGIVGHYAVQPRPFRLLGAPCLAGLAIGTMVHPAARNVNTLLEMAGLAYSLCAERGISFLYAFPNNEAWRIRQALLGWQPLPPLVEWVGPPLALATCGEKEAEEVGRSVLAGDWTPNVSLSGLTEEPVLATTQGMRTADWLHWRYSKKPDAEYAVHIVERGYAVSKRYSREGVLHGHIVDWQVAAGDARAEGQLLRLLSRQFSEWGVEQVSCWSLPALSLTPYLRDAGFTQTGRTTNFGYLGLSPDKNDPLAKKDAWSVQMADSDVY